MALSVENLVIEAGDKLILDGVNVTFPEGRITSVIGPNGAGKSTLLKAAANINSNYKGRVLLDGEDIRSIKRSDLARKLAVLPQGMTTPSDITVEQLVDYGRFPYRSWFKRGNPQEDKEAVEWAMQVTNLGHLSKRQVASLSGGERQRAWIAMALAQKPRILLLDEPTTYLDIAHQLEVLEIVRKINMDWGMTIIMVLHDLNQSAKYSHNLVVIKDKGIRAEGSPQDVLTKEFLAEVFGVRAESYRNAMGEEILNPVAVIK